MKTVFLDAYRSQRVYCFPVTHCLYDPACDYSNVDIVHLTSINYDHYCYHYYH